MRTMSEYRLVSNEPPFGGACVAEPSDGIALDTSFKITCSNFTDSDTPLTYTFIVDRCSNGTGLFTADSLLRTGLCSVFSVRCSLLSV